MNILQQQMLQLLANPNITNIEIEGAPDPELWDFIANIQEIFDYMVSFSVIYNNRMGYYTIEITRIDPENIED